MGFIRQKADGILVKKKKKNSPKPIIGSFVMVNSMRMADWGPGWGSVLTDQVALQLLSFPDVWRFQLHRTCCSGLRSLGYHLLGPREETPCVADSWGRLPLGPHPPKRSPTLLASSRCSWACGGITPTSASIATWPFLCRLLPLRRMLVIGVRACLDSPG